MARTCVIQCNLKNFPFGADSLPAEACRLFRSSGIRMGQSANVIVDEMVDKNTYDVDAVSGATVSSEIIMNAVNNALQKGLK